MYARMSRTNPLRSNEMDFFKTQKFSIYILWVTNGNFWFSRALDSQTTARQVQSPAERRKDIVAQAMQEQKIFEENVPKSEPVVKQENSHKLKF